MRDRSDNPSHHDSLRIVSQLIINKNRQYFEFILEALYVDSVCVCACVCVCVCVRACVRVCVCVCWQK